MLRLIPLGGLGEIGLNALVLEVGEERLLIDAGLLFPPPDSPGVDVIFPDFEYLLQHPNRLTGVLLTHGHEDHIGALSSLLRRISVPVYGGRYTLGVVARKLDEAGVRGDLRETAPGERFRIGEHFRVEPLHVCHSTPDAMGFCVQTPEGRVVHTGDFKLDDSPWDGRPTDLTRLAALGDEGVLALLSDSTNSEVEGHTGSEAIVRQTFERLLRESTGRIVVALFASNIPRIHHLVQLCHQQGRRVVLLGRSMLRAVELAESLGILKVPPGLLVSHDEASHLPRERLAIFTTGAQGEPRAGLRQLSGGHPEELALEPGDHVLLSARAIPGNERAVGDLINRLCAQGIQVSHSGNTPGIHVSGHAASAQQRKVIEHVRPLHFMPVHGEARHLQAHLRTARASGVSAEGLLLASDGNIIEFEQGRGQLHGAIPAGRRWMTRPGELVVGEGALKERRALAETGLVIVTVVVDRETGALLTGPQLTGQGLIDEEIALLPRLADPVRARFLEVSPSLRTDPEVGGEALRRAVRQTIRERLGRRPSVVDQIIKL